MTNINISQTKDPNIFAEVKNFLNNHKKMVLSIKDKEGHPDSSLLLYVIDDDFNFYFGTCKSFGKYMALKADPHIAIAVVQESVDPLQVLDAKALASEIDAEKTKEMLEWFVSKNDAKYYIKDKEDYVMFKAEPLSVRWLDASDGNLNIYDLQLENLKKDCC